MGKFFVGNFEINGNHNCYFIFRTVFLTWESIVLFFNFEIDENPNFFLNIFYCLLGRHGLNLFY
jgi:hypothetical protein